MKRLALLFLICLSVVSLDISKADSETGLLIFPERQPFFEKSTYKANVVDGIIEIMDGPIRLSNCDVYNFDIKITADETKYYPIVNPPSPSNSIKNCSILLFAFTKNCVAAEDILYDIITVEAYVDDYYQVARTNIVIINSSTFDPYKLIYNVNGTEYVILNYFYFKLFLLIVVVTGALILVLEIREIILSYRNRSYLHLEDEISHI